MSKEEIRLTQYSHGAGCGCKIAPQVLDEILKSSSSKLSFPSLLIGNSGKDDAAVYKWNEEESIIATTDFFTPIVDDPLTFGMVAAANAISDVYAMGGEPILALAILGWPIEKLPVEAAQKVLEGARIICDEAGIPLAGGHSIDIPEPVFGLSVNGRIKTKHIKQNNQAKVGDVLLITKPIGIGVLATAEKRGLIEPEDKANLYAKLTELNKLGLLLGRLEGVTAMTDVTGFGLAGHLIEMCEGANLSAELEYQAIPKLANIQNYLSKNSIPDATYRNWKGYGQKIQLGASVNFMEAFQLLPDPQTNGGLLVAVRPGLLEEVQQVFNENGYGDFIQPIGRIIEKNEKVILVN